MDGKGRATDNTWIERFWKSIKYNHVYLSPADTGLELHQGILNYIEYYHQKKHQSLGVSPYTAYYQTKGKTAA
jgi:putative transposase